MATRRDRYQASSPAPSDATAAIAPGPHHAASHTFSPSGDTVATVPAAGSHRSRRRRSATSSTPSTSGIHAGASPEPLDVVPEPSAPALSAPSPATPSRT